MIIKEVLYVRWNDALLRAYLKRKLLFLLQVAFLRDIDHDIKICSIVTAIANFIWF